MHNDYDVQGIIIIVAMFLVCFYHTGFPVSAGEALHIKPHALLTLVDLHLCVNYENSCQSSAPFCWGFIAISCTKHKCYIWAHKYDQVVILSNTLHPNMYPITRVFNRKL